MKPHDLLTLSPALPAVSPCQADSPVASMPGARALYDALWKCNATPDATLRAEAQAFIEQCRIEARCSAGEPLPGPDALPRWMQANLEATGARYKRYLAARKAGGPRQYFSSRAHALYFLRAVAPTKLVDGAWLYGLLNDSGNPRLSDLIFTYLEELGDGRPDKNHVLIYRRLLDAMGILDWRAQDDRRYVQGALQLSLAACTDTMLPEVVGFNLGYEQMPLHLLVTAYELDELGIDPTYFSLHVTVDNAAGGHAQRALLAAAEIVPGTMDRAVFWRRVEDGYRMSETGWGTNDAIASFDLHAELLRVMAHRAGEGQASHSDHCRIEGRTVNEWLSKPDGVPAFVDALQRGGWLVRDTDPAESRFWRLLQGETPHMFGVFNDYELQVIHDWIRGEAASDGMKFERGPAGATSAARRPVRSFRQSQRLASARGTGNPSLLSSDASPRFDPDLDALRRALNDGDDPVRQGTLLRQLLGPAFHWGTAGLEATRHVSSLMRAVA